MADLAPDTPDLRLARRPEIGRMPQGSPREQRLRELWESEPGWRGWLSTVDHKQIGLRYIVTAFVFLIAGASRR